MASDKETSLELKSSEDTQLFGLTLRLSHRFSGFILAFTLETSNDFKGRKGHKDVEVIQIV
jgi:hypothetical protein